jgi:hypothetical protein
MSRALARRTPALRVTLAARFVSFAALSDF